MSKKLKILETDKKEKIEITVDEFLLIVSGGKHDFDRNYIIAEGNTISFSNIKIKEDVLVINSIFARISFEDCLLNNLQISNCGVSTLLILDTEMGTLLISRNDNLRFDKVFIKKSTIADIFFHNCSMDSISIYQSNTRNFVMTNTSVDYFDILIGSKLASILISIKSKVGRFQIGESFIGNIGFDGSAVQNIIINNSGVFKINFNAIECTDIKYKGGVLQHFDWQQKTFVNLTLERVNIETFNITASTIPKDSIIQVIDCNINSIILETFINTAFLFISNLNPLKNNVGYDKSDAYGIKYHAENTSGFFWWLDIEKKSSLKFVNSDLGKTSFVNCNLNDFDVFVYSNTKMVDVFVAGSTFPKKISFNEKVNQKEQERLAYGQFKKIYENRGDSVHASEFFSLEMDAYLKQLFLNLHKDWFKVGQILNILLNKISSNHGNNWFQAILVTLAVNSLFFWWYCNSLGYILGNDWGLFRKLASYSFEFLNPLRKPDFLVTDYISPKARVIDYLSRIIIAYFSYQTIQAFRRFGRKS